MQVIKTMWEKSIIFPDILNAIKYTLSILVAISSYYSKTFEIFEKTWLLIAAFSSCWSYCWDMKMDYGLIQSGTSNRLLRDQLFYQRKWIYYTAMILNLMGRFAWVLTISPDMVYRWIRPEFFLMVIYMIEMCRRGMWNFFRIELKHIDLCKHYQVSDKTKLPEYSEIIEIVEKHGINISEKDIDKVINQGEKFGESNNIKDLNDYLANFRKKSNEVEDDKTDYYKLIHEKDD